uniref:Type III effector n=1 Tax=Strongyloides venezuelensis TaxID=75913 RepID=A0A0K0FQ60_STRVS
MFNTKVDLIKYLQANQVRNNSQFQLDGVNISVEDISGNNPNVSVSKNKVDCIVKALDSIQLSNDSTEI